MCELGEFETGDTMLCGPEGEGCESVGITDRNLGRVCGAVLATAAGPLGTGTATTVTMAVAAVRINARENLI